MSAPKSALPWGMTVADLLARLGDVPAYRVRLDPPPGRATEKDVILLEAREDRLFELVDGVLVEKASAFLESCLAMVLGRHVGTAADETGRGFVTGPSGAFRLPVGTIRMPDVA